MHFVSLRLYSHITNHDYEYSYQVKILNVHSAVGPAKSIIAILYIPVWYFYCYIVATVVINMFSDWIHIWEHIYNNYMHKYYYSQIDNTCFVALHLLSYFDLHVHKYYHHVKIINVCSAVITFITLLVQILVNMNYLYALRFTAPVLICYHHDHEYSYQVKTRNVYSAVGPQKSITAILWVYSRISFLIIVSYRCGIHSCDHIYYITCTNISKHDLRICALFHYACTHIFNNSWLRIFLPSKNT